MVTIQVEDYDFLDMLMDRVREWNKGYEVEDLYSKMYEQMITKGMFNSVSETIMSIVDNDVVNNCSVYYDDNDEFDDILNDYKNGKDCTDYGFIEAVDDKNHPTMFLMRN